MIIDIDMDKIFKELKEYGWAPDRMTRVYVNRWIKNMKGDKGDEKILPDGQSPFHLFELQKILTSFHFIRALKPGPEKQEFIKRLVEEFNKEN